jgi:hypothetical protein
VRSAKAHLLAAAIPLASLFAAARADAVEVPNVGGKPLLIDITNTAVVDYHFNNRDDSLFAIPAQVNDNYGELLDRLNVQASWWRLRLGLRLDGALFYHRPTRDTVADIVADQKNLLDQYKKDPNGYTNDFYRELHSRYLRAFYPSKLFVGYNQPGLDVTVGDFYVQLGRGLVFSVRKIDELAVDTTVRGAKVVFDREVGPVHLGATAFAGQMNPLRVDETSGRRLNGDGSPLFFGFPRPGDLETYKPQVGSVLTVVQPGAPSYLTDSAFGGRVEVGTKWFTLAANSAALLRSSNTDDWINCVNGGKDTAAMGTTRITGKCDGLYPEFTTSDPSKQHNRIVNVSGSLNVPSIAKHGDLYLEVAGQQMGAGHTQYAPNKTDPSKLDVLGPAKDLSGYAIYGSGSITGGPVSVSLEGKFYKNFFPLSAHIDTATPGFGAPEFALVTYSQPPTAEPIYTTIVGGGSPQVCVAGGRARADYRFNTETSAYAWVGRYSSWSEVPYNLSDGCGMTRANQTDTWDAAVGLDMGFEGGKSHVKAWVGARTSDHAEQQVNPDGSLASNVFYREGYIRYDIIKHLTGRFSLQFQGFHRHRFEPISFVQAWTEGENYTALQWSPHLSVIFGYEYMAKEQCQPDRPATLSQPARPAKDLCHFVNGGLQWRTAGIGGGAGKYVGQLFDSVSVFVGQRRAALRCVSGVCRQFPPFEGARLEITSRF